MRKCRFCAEPIEDHAVVCLHCGKDLYPGRATAATAAQGPATAIDGGAITVVPPSPIARVSVVDINMPFASMVGFMIKWAIAAIPALLILGFLSAIVLGVLAGLTGNR